MAQHIRFRRLAPDGSLVWPDGRIVLPDGAVIPVERWEIARDEAELLAKLDGQMAEVLMPPRPWWVRAWRWLFPIRFNEAKATDGQESRDKETERYWRRWNAFDDIPF